MSTSRSARRADAARNRASIVAAARAMLLEVGDLRLNGVAKAAGVGQGTLYRHFPNRESLLAELYREDVAELVAAADELRAVHTPLDALGAWFDRILTYTAVKRGVVATLTTPASQALTDHSYPSIQQALTSLLQAGQASGEIRPDVDARDILLLMGALTRLTNEEWPERARGILRVLLDAVRARP